MAHGVGRLLLLAWLFWFGTLLHEAGHVVSAWVFGARLVHLNILGLDLFPRLDLNPHPGYYGFMRYEGALTPIQQTIVSLCGSLATLSAASIAQVGLWLTHLHRRWVRLGVLTFCFFWLDILTHTLPTMGIPAYLFFGKRAITSAAEAYLAAVELGMPGWLFQTLTLSVSLGLLAATITRWCFMRRIDMAESKEVHSRRV